MKYALLSILGSVAALSTFACSSSDGDTSTDTSTAAATSDDYDDVAQSLAISIAAGTGGGEVGSISDSVDLVVGLPPLDLTVKGSGEFAGVRAGLAYDYTLACKDEQGESLEACGAMTDAATVQVAWSGNLALPNFNAAVTRSGQWQVDGVKSGTATFSGNGDFSFDATFKSSFRDIERQWTLDYSADYSAIQVRLLPRAIVGGAIHYDVTASRQASSDRGDSAARFVMSADIAFSNGSASLTLDGKTSYAIDVNTGAVARTR